MLSNKNKITDQFYFDWIIEEQTINKILAREFGIGDRISDIEQEAFEQNRQREAEKYKAQQEELAKQRAEEEKNREIDKLAERLMSEELEKLENSWTEEALEKAKSAFKSYVLAEASQDTSMEKCKKLLDEYGWNSIFADFYFREFKIKHFLNCSFDWFRNQAELQLKQ
jgi:hypothetical protein